MSGIEPGSAGFAPERDIAVILGMVTRYFKTLSGKDAEFLPATISLTVPPAPEFSGRMDLEGSCCGWLSIGLGAPLLTLLLREIGEDLETEAALLDMSGEFINTIVSNARSHFGARLKLRPPRTAVGEWAGGWEGRPPMLFNIPFRWDGQEGLLVLAIKS